MNISLLYILSISSVMIVIITGYFMGSNHLTQFLNCQVSNKNEITSIKLAERLIKKNNLLNVHVVRLKSKRTNYYSFNFNVVKLSPAVINSSFLNSLAISTHCIKDAKLSQRKTGLYMLLIVLQFISKFFTIIFVPTLLIIAILNTIIASQIPALILLIALIGYISAFIIQFILFTLNLKLIKSIVKDVKIMNLLEKEEFKQFSTLCNNLCRIRFYQYTKISLNFFSLASPDILFKQDRFEQ